MLGYICKYTPVEIFEAMDTEIVRIEPSAVSFTQADTLMHSNICSFAKGVLETFGETDYEGLVFTTCCDSMRRLYDVLKRRFPEKWLIKLNRLQAATLWGEKSHETATKRFCQGLHSQQYHAPGHSNDFRTANQRSI